MPGVPRHRHLGDACAPFRERPGERGARGRHEVVATDPARYGGDEFWEPNSARLTWVIAVDVDHSDGVARALWTAVPKPSWVVENPANGHTHAAWIIEPVSHGPNARLKPQRYLADVREALRDAVGGDPHFTGVRSRNPLWRHAITYWGPMSARSLGELARPLRSAGLWPSAVLRRPVSGDTSLGISGPIRRGARNVTIFEIARRADDPRAAAEAANRRCDPPLSPAEVASIVRSILRYRERRGGWEGSEELPGSVREVLSEFGRKGGSAASEAQAQQRSMRAASGTAVRSAQATLRAEAARALQAQGSSTAEIAEALGVTIRTVQRALRASDISGASG
ncbi:replication initiation protein [Luteipulveratus halotolerans]|uniref:replication initiation protein n=1 Tax=Luteipulveratus halotolerans TaxID=1631356 RepID=UPI0009E5170F